MNQVHDYEAIIGTGHFAEESQMVNAAAQLGQHVKVREIWNVERYNGGQAIGLMFSTEEFIDYDTIMEEFDDLETIERLATVNEE